MVGVIGINRPVGSPDSVIISCASVKSICITIALHICTHLGDLGISASRRFLAFNQYPVSEDELSTQVRLIWLEDTAVAVAEVGFARGVVPLASLENAESPAALLAQTR